MARQRRPRPFHAPTIDLGAWQTYRGETALFRIDPNDPYSPGTWLVMYVRDEDGEYHGQRIDLHDADPNDLVQLSRDCEPGSLPSNPMERSRARIRSYENPSPYVLERVRSFVETHGLLMGTQRPCCSTWAFEYQPPADADAADIKNAGESKHQLFQNKLALDRFHNSIDIDDDMKDFLPRRSVPFESEYFNAVPWLLSEAQVFAHAMEVWAGLAHFRATADASRIATYMKSLIPDDDNLHPLPLQEGDGALRPQSRQRNAYWVGFAYRELRNLINKHMGLCTIGLRFDFPEDEPERERLRLAAGGLRLTPTCSLGSYWLTLATRVQDWHREHICLNCGERFPPSREDQVYCTPEHGDRYRAKIVRLPDEGGF